MTRHVTLDQEAVRCRFRLRTGCAGLLEDKKRIKMIEDERCILCNSGEAEDVEHFLVGCDEFAGERQGFLERIGEVDGTDKWIDAYHSADGEGRAALMLGQRVEGLDTAAMEAVDNVVMGEVLKWWTQRKELLETFTIPTPWLWAPIITYSTSNHLAYS